MTTPCVVSIKGEHNILWRAVDQDGYVLDVLVQKRRNTKAAKRLIRKLLSAQGCAPRVMVTDKLRSYGAAKRVIGLSVCDHRQHKGRTIGQRIRISRSDDASGL